MPQEYTTQAVVKTMKQLLSEHGGHYDSLCYLEFAPEWGFEHIANSTHFPQSSGFIERQLQTAKATIRKATFSGFDVDKVMLCLRATQTAIFTKSRRTVVQSKDQRQSSSTDRKQSRKQRGSTP